MFEIQGMMSIRRSYSSTNISKVTMLLLVLVQALRVWRGLVENSVARITKRISFGTIENNVRTLKTNRKTAGTHRPSSTVRA